MTPTNLHDALDKDFAPAWRPEPGDKLVGVVTDLGEREGYDGDPYPIVTIEPENGQALAVHCFHAVLQNELARIRPKVGDQLGIKYLGQTKAASGRSSYHSYRVQSAGATAGVNWSKYGGDDAGTSGSDEIEPDLPVDAPTPDDDGPIPF